MAEMIPDRLPDGASAGEKKVFALLQGLPDDVIVYYEPIVGNRYPDFIVILPSLGVLIIEAKGWYPAHISAANTTDIDICSRKGGPIERQKHPVRQAREYKFQLMDLAKNHPETAALLLRADGPQQGRLSIPFGNIAFLNNCTRAQLDEKGLTEIFPQGQNVSRDEMAALSDLDEDQLLSEFKKFFDPWFAFDVLDERKVNALRSVIHPEIVISAPAPAPNAARASETPSGAGSLETLKTMDLRQENNARSIGEGHRVVYGVAGSGKTVILIARAKLIAAHPEKRCLILCYNKDLAAYFKQIFFASPNVECRHFHDWGGKSGARFRRDEPEEAYGLRFLDRLEGGSTDLGAYDAVFIDEAQDFAKSWFQCAKLALKEPDDGDLLIVGDGAQSVYQRRPFTWAAAGVHAQGRTIHKKYDLDKNYRNTREVLQVASQFVRRAEGDVDPDAIMQIVEPDIASCERSGPKPQIFIADSLDMERQAISEKVTSWIENGARPDEIAILYRANTKRWVERLSEQLSRRFPVNWQRGRSPEYASSGGVVITTMHSSKGRQWKNVVIARADQLPFMDEPTATERGLMYVAMTRAEQELHLTASSRSGFADEIDALLAQDLSPRRLSGPARRLQHTKG